MRRALIKYEQKIHSFILKGRQLVRGEKFIAEAAEPYSADLAPENPADFGSTSGKITIRLGGKKAEAHYNLSAGQADLLIDGFYYRMERQSGSAGDSNAGHALELRAEIPGRIVKVLCSVGVTVEAGTSLIVHEAMKMEMQLKAPVRVKIAEIFVGEGAQVDADAKLIRFAVADEA
jgi:biotin carboxyl carrier protein